MDNTEERLLQSILPEEEETKIKELDDSKDLTLIKFINSNMRKALAKDSLRTKIIELLNNRLNRTDSDDITFGELMQALAIMDKNDNDLTLGFVNALKDLQQPPEPSKNGEGGNNFTGKEMQVLRKAISLIDKVYDEEVSDSEDEEEDVDEEV